MKMFTRAGRAALFDRKAFTEAFFDDDAAADGAIVVAGVGAVSYLGRLVWLGNLGSFTLSNLFAFVVAAVVSWLVLSFATWFSGSRLFGSGGRPQRMIAMQGLAALPLLLEVFGGLLGGVGLVWYLGVLVVATGEAADLDPKKAAVSVLIGFAAAVIIRAIIGVPFAIIGSLF